MIKNGIFAEIIFEKVTSDRIKKLILVFFGGNKVN